MTEENPSTPGWMGRVRKEHLLLLGIFFLSLAFRLSFALQTEEFSSPESYSVLRQVEHIREEKVPLFEDPLSYGGRRHVFLPLFHYLLTAFSLLSRNPLILKVFLNTVASSIVFVTYLVCRDLTKNREASLMAAFLSGFIPIYISQTVNTLSVYSVSVPLLFLLLYFLQLVHKDQRVIPGILGLLLLLSILHASILLLVIGFLFYLLLLKMENMGVSRAETEVVLFATFFVTWLQFIFFKPVLLKHGPAVVWQNIPPQLLSRFFSEFDLIGAISLIGLLPFIFGLYAGYKHIVVERRRVAFLFLGFALAVFSLMGMRLISLDLGLIYLGFTLVFLFGQGYKLFLVELSKSKAEPYSRWIKAGFILVVFLTGMLPSAAQALRTLTLVPTEAELAAFSWIRNSTPEDATVLATLDEGHYITALAHRKNVVDDNFLMVERAGDRLSDIETVFTTTSQTEAIQLLDKYDVDYVYIWGARERYGIDSLPTEDERCLVRVYPETGDGSDSGSGIADAPVILEKRCTIQVED